MTLHKSSHLQSRVTAAACLACYGYIDKLSLRQYSAYIVDSLGLGIKCLIALYYVYKASRSCLL